MPQDASSPLGFRVLVIVSRPLDLDDLPNLADQWALQNGLRRVQAPAFLKMLRLPTVEGLRLEIMNGYDIVHFDGHGALGIRCPNCGALHLPLEKKCDRCEALLEDEEAKGYFAFEREDSKLDALAAEELAEIVTSAPQPAKLVFLSACESAKGGDASLQNVLLAKGVPVVLGMNESVSLKATMALAGPFYAGLGAGMTIVRAFENALPALKKMENGAQLQKIPVLEGPGKDARILAAKVTGRASFEAEPLFGVPEYEFVGDFIRGDPPRGRKGLLSQTMDALQGGEKLVVLTGQGGIGKTRLAAEAARRLAWRYPGGIFWRSAAEMERLGLEEMLNAFDNVFGPQLRTLPIDAKRDQVLGYLRNYDTASLLVVDNAESIRDPGLWRFLEGIPQPSAALVTTRESLPCGGREIRVPEMENEEAIRLFFREARKSFLKWGEHLSPEERGSLAEIAGFMQGHPLAIKLTAALMASRSLTSIRDELRLNPPKEVSDRFDVSYRSLTEGQRNLFCRLAVFSGSMTEEAVGSICIDEDQKGNWNWQSDLGELERRSFLDRIEIEAQDESGNQVTIYRYHLHPLMRQYAVVKAGVDLLARLQPWAAEYFLGYAQHFNNSYDMLDMEKRNILFCMEWAANLMMSSYGEEREMRSRLVLGFMAAIDDFLDIRGYWNDLGWSLRQAIVASEILDDKKTIQIGIHKLGTLSQKKGDYCEARRLYQRSMKISQELGDVSGESSSLHNLGVLAYTFGDYVEARSYLHRSLKIDQEMDDKKGVANSLNHLGLVAHAIGDYDEACKLYKQSLKVKMEIGELRGASSSLTNLGNIAQITGNNDEAIKYYQQSWEIDQELGDKSGAARSSHNLGTLAQAMGKHEEARKLYLQSIKIKQELGDKNGVASSLNNLGILAQLAGKNDEARQIYQQSMKIKQDLGDKSGVASSLHNLGALAQTTGDYDEARQLYQQSMKIKQELGDKSGIALSKAQLALLEVQMGNAKEALQFIREAEATFMEIGSTHVKQARALRQRLEQYQ
ncbi:MAG: tetratricopeptide repeat protein [Methanothrix sp.]|jgi:tetratricopeptide (TPR) repeat protein|nr:tetratricopeptide repeat protein [Methanothrix sp.]